MKHNKILLTMIVSLPMMLLAEGDFSLPDIPSKNDWVERGTAEYRKFGFHVYDAKFWAKPKQNQPPYALQLKYFMDIKASRIVEASIKEMRGLGVTEEQLTQWEVALNQVIPNVKDGDVITGVNTGEGADFYLNGCAIGRVDDPMFATDFFGIWLSPKTSDRKLRQILLQQ